MIFSTESHPQNDKLAFIDKGLENDQWKVMNVRKKWPMKGNGCKKNEWQAANKAKSKVKLTSSATIDKGVQILIMAINIVIVDKLPWQIF